jgi:hypothetical protein
MGKFLATIVQDAALDIIANSGTEMYVCAGQPTSRADAITRAGAPAISLSSGDFSKSSSGGARVLTVSGKTTTGDSTKTLDHVAICSGTALLAVTTCPAQPSASGVSITIAASTYTIDQPI